MLYYILLGLAVLVIVLIAVIATRPADFRVTRTATMRGPASAAFAQVNDFHNWEAWSPFAKYDPNAKLTYEGPSPAWEPNTVGTAIVRPAPA